MYGSVGGEEGVRAGKEITRTIWECQVEICSLYAAAWWGSAFAAIDWEWRGRL